jgi:polysaccharide deacetylase 2 family uncharacterized protein YibQ
LAKKRKRRRANSAPLVALALLCAAVAAWGIFGRGSHPPRLAHAPSAAPAVTPQTPAVATPAVTPVATSAATPSASPSAPAGPPHTVRVALIIDDCGQWLDTEEALLALPIPITMSVLPHVRYASKIAQDASSAGKGVMLHLPMEAASHINAGPGEIETSMSDAQIAATTEDDVAQVPLAKGVNNHEGSAASADPRVMKDVIDVLKTHGLFFIDSRTSTKTVAEDLARSAGVPAARRNVFLDNRADVAYTESMLERATAIAEQNGSAIAIGHPKPSTLEAIRLMYPKMEQQGVQFVLAQDLVR